MPFPISETGVLQLVLQVPCHPSRHLELRSDPLAVMDAVDVASVAGTMATTWSTAACLIADLAGAGWAVSADALGSNNYVEVRAAAPGDLPGEDALRFARELCRIAEGQGMHATLWWSEDEVSAGEPIRARTRSWTADHVG